MIFEKLIDFFIGSLNALFSIIPIFSFAFRSDMIHPALEIIRTVGYLLPMDAVIAILSLSLSIQLFKIMISVIKTFWDVLPFT